MTDSIIGVVVISSLTVFILRRFWRERPDYASYIPRLQHFIGGSRSDGQAIKRAEEIIESRTEVK